MCYTTNIYTPVKVCKQCSGKCLADKILSTMNAKGNQIHINGVYNSSKVKNHIFRFTNDQESYYIRSG